MGVKKSLTRVDALQKVTGQAKYVEDLIPVNALHAKVVRSTVANGLVKKINTDKAMKMPGVEYILTCFDIPDTLYATAGHPIALDPDHADIKDKLILSRRVRYYGDEVAVVVADTVLHAELAAEQVEVEYEEYEPMMEPEDAIGNSSVLHEFRPTNELARMDFTIDKDGNTRFYSGKFDNTLKIAGRDDMIGEHYYVPAVNACHIENNGCFAYMEGKKIIVVTCNQVPLTLRRNIAEAIEVPVSDVRVIKPYLGGGFGNKQDTMYEPIVALLTKRLGGRPVSLMLTREETFSNTRTRHAFDMSMYAEVSDEGEFLRKGLRINSNGGAYAAHNHAVAAYAITSNFQTYRVNGEQVGESSTAYTTRPAAAAMRGYGIPQLSFAMESQMDDIAREKGWDPIEFRLHNINRKGFIDPFDKFEVLSNGLEECVRKGVEMSDWYNKRKEYDEFNKTSKDLKKGIGMALFSYKIGVWPLQLESGSCRIVMHEDGGCTIQIGCTELGQGSDTIMAQIVSEITTIPESKITVASFQDSDITPYDNGAYASRQTYISGGACKQTAELLKKTLISYAAEMKGIPAEGLDLKDEKIVDRDGKPVLSISEVSTFMNFVNDQKTKTDHITAESTYTASYICMAFGCSFVDLEVDVPTGKIKLKKVYAVHDSGQIMNPKLAEAQVHGGVGMGLGYALGEQLLYDKNGKPLNNNLLDYKVPTTMDLPDIEVAFVETYEPSGPFGAKGLAEPPNIPQAPAVRNAVLHATGVGVHKLPMNPQNLVEAFRNAGLYDRK